MSKKYNIGLFGFGNIGQGLYEIISHEDMPLNIEKICVRQKDKTRSIPLDNFIYDADVLLDDKSIDFFVELVNDDDVAYHIVKTALLKGKPIISANKKLIATRFLELSSFQSYKDGLLKYEASVCGSIPIISLLDEFYCNDLINSISTICNGTCNYILSKVEEGHSFKEALLDAQNKGFAEYDSSSDVMGYDARYKLTIILANSAGLILKPSQIFCFGIQNITSEDFDFAKRNDSNIKLIANLHVNPDNKISAYILPQLISNNNPFSKVRDEVNALMVDTKYIGQHFFSGAGAGAYPTAMAVLKDILSISRGNSVYCQPFLKRKRYHFDPDINVKLYLRCKDQKLLNEIKLLAKTYQYIQNYEHVLLLEINLNSLIQFNLNERKDVFLICC